MSGGVKRLEEWKDIEGYEGLYMVSNTGKIKALEKVIVRERILKPGIVGGYERVNLYNENGAAQEYVHRLVAKAFIENPDNLPYINHKDEDKRNNVVANLEWCSPAYNVNYGTARERRIAHTDFNRINGARKKKVYQYSLKGEFIKEYESLSECARINNYCASNISKVCRRGKGSAYGYIFRYRIL